MSANVELPSFSEPIGVFPLPNVVLFPGATLPLQIFEPRYRALVRDALDDDPVMALALLRPDYEAHYYTNLAEIHPVVCVGRITEYVRMPDGRYFINLLGVCRARIRQEERGGEYRQAMLDPMIWPESGIEVDGEYNARDSIRRIVESDVFDTEEEVDKVRHLINSPTSLDRVMDAIASTLLPGDRIEIRQRLLEEMNVLRRAETLVHELVTVQAELQSRQRSNKEWPRFGSMN